MTIYKSSVMQHHAMDDECAVCRFICGDFSAADTLMVIQTLDQHLHEKEQMEAVLLDVIAGLKEERRHVAADK